MSSAAERRLADVRKRFSWWDTHPQLTLSIWPTKDGLNLSLRTRTMLKNGQRDDHLVLEATWAPAEVTEAKIVDWAQRGLAHYLAQLVQPGQD